MPSVRFFSGSTIAGRRRSPGEATLAGMDEAMKIRLAELRRSGESVIQLVESQLIDKVKLLRRSASCDRARPEAGRPAASHGMENVRSAVELASGSSPTASKISSPRRRRTSRGEDGHHPADRIARIRSQHRNRLDRTAPGARIDELTYRAAQDGVGSDSRPR